MRFLRQVRQSHGQARKNHEPLVQEVKAPTLVLRENLAAESEMAEEALKKHKVRSRN